MTWLILQISILESYQVFGVLCILVAGSGPVNYELEQVTGTFWLVQCLVALCVLLVVTLNGQWLLGATYSEI
jgi:hypothetical protein